MYYLIKTNETYELTGDRPEYNERYRTIFCIGNVADQEEIDIGIDNYPVDFEMSNPDLVELIKEARAHMCYFESMELSVESISRERALLFTQNVSFEEVLDAIAKAE